jgi:hypothetical protein
MLTVEILKQNTALASLNDTVLATIAEMSKNDENTVIGTRIGALHGQYDADIFSITGIKKNDGEKSYDYAKRVLVDYKKDIAKNSVLKQSLEAASAKVTELQSQIEAQKGNEALAQQLKDTKAQVSQLQAKLTAKESELNTKEQEYATAIRNTHVDYAFKEAMSGLAFKNGISEPIQKALIAAAKADVLAKGTPDLITDANGNQVLALRGADGNILNNPSNGLNPYTIKELVMETAIKDALETGRGQKGGGTGEGGGKGKNTSLVDLSSAKTQVEADDIISRHLLSNGLTRDSQEFADQLLQLRADNNIASLPIR